MKTTDFSTSFLPEKKKPVSETPASFFNYAMMELLKTKSTTTGIQFLKTRSSCMPAKYQKVLLNLKKRVFCTEIYAHAISFCTMMKLSLETLIALSFIRNLNAVTSRVELISTQLLNKLFSWLLCQTRNSKKSEISSFLIFNPNAIFTFLE